MRIMRKMGLEEWSELYNRPRYRYAGSANQNSPRRRGGGIDITNSNGTTTNKPRFRKVVETPGLNTNLKLPNWLSASLMSAARLVGNTENNEVYQLDPFSGEMATVYDAAVPPAVDVNAAYKRQMKSRFTKNSYDDSKEGMSQNAYLMGKDRQKKAMLNKGYVYKGNIFSGENPNRLYSFGQAAHQYQAKGYAPDVYQTQPDEYKESETVPLIGKNYKGKSYFVSEQNGSIGKLITDEHAGLPHAYNHPIHLLADANTGRVLIQGDDLNDYGGNSWFNYLGKIIDYYGNPHVVTTGPRTLNTIGQDVVLSEKGKDVRKYGVRFATTEDEQDAEDNGKNFESPLVSYLKDPTNNMVLMSDEYYPTVGYALRETVVRPNNRNYTKPKQWKFSYYK